MPNPDMMDAPASYDSGQDRSQPTKRRYQLYKDQHGRRWGAPVEKSTGEPCGFLETQGWAAPLFAPSRFMKVDPIENTLDIDYEGWVRSVDEAHAEWEKLLREYAIQLYGQGGVTAAIAHPQPELLDRVGPKPKQLREPIEALMAGNKWMLGLSEIKPAWALEFFPDEPEPELLSEIEITNKYPDAEDEDNKTYPHWAGPHNGWKLSDDSYVPRFGDEHKDDYKQRALDAEASLHA